MAVPFEPTIALLLALRWARRLAFWFLVVSLGLVLLYKYVPVPLTLTIVGRMLESRPANRGGFVFRKTWVPLDEMSPHIRKAVVCAEDQLFLYHIGFDFDAIDRAIGERERGERFRGASTISQQVAKNVFLWQGGGWLRKGLESWFTLLIELVWSKRRILEVYLNVAEMGDGIFGAEAAARAYFRKPAKYLTPREAALIVVSLPNPREMNPGKPSGYVSRRAYQIAAAVAQMPPDYYQEVVND